jgi:D-alanyl-lipoteichoic acid acyltransferase DltB (MBOAT superfamily)
MQFNTPKFLVFVVAALALYWTARRDRHLRAAVLVVASYAFYAAGNPRFLVILLAVSVSDFYLALWMARQSQAARRRAILVLSLVVDLGLLAFFKYANFFLGSYAGLADWLRLPVGPRHISLAAPVGISFYLFRTIGHMVDVYRRKTPPCGFLPDYLIFIAFFPAILSGPIMRGGNFLPQLPPEPRMTRERLQRILFLLTSGLIKKFLVADFIAVRFTDMVFQVPLMYSSAEMLLAILGYSLQLYADFAGYTDLALGLGLAFGLELPENFNFPYKSINLREFWQRWHISFSSWLRDYLYVSVGGSRVDRPWKIYRNLMITMTLGGWWHGASWNFVLWGALHGAGLCVTRWVQRLRPQTSPPGPVRRALSALGVFLFVTLCWTLFRVSDFGLAKDIVANLRLGSWRLANFPLSTAAMMGAAVVGMWLPAGVDRRLRQAYGSLPLVLKLAILAAVGYVAFTWLADRTPHFVYEQF